MPNTYTIKDCQEFAETKGGKCLSVTYKNMKEKMKWICSKEHIFEMTFDSVKIGNHWCPFCFGRYNNSLELCQEIAEERGGKCLSTEYKNNRENLLWMCSESHIWEACFRHVKHNNTWCPSCYGNKKLSLEICQEIAKQNGGKCLSTEYINTTEIMSWMCSNNHIFETPLQYIKYDNTWCPYCSKGRSEKLVKNIFEIIFQQDFVTIRPEFLGGLELDGYCENLGLAFEYNGIQHYEYVPHFHKYNISNFHKQQEYDKLKQQICKKHNITLIIIPYTYSYKNPRQLEDYIYTEVLKYEYLYRELINVESIIIL